MFRMMLFDARILHWYSLTYQNIYTNIVLVDDIKTLECRDLWLSRMGMFGLQFFLALCSNTSGGVQTLLEEET